MMTNASWSPSAAGPLPGRPASPQEDVHSTTTTAAHSRRASVLSEWVVQFVTREMSKPENRSYALSWKQLHLSRAKLKASSRTSALLSGFAMVAMVEVQLSANIPGALLIAFSICTTLLVSVHMLALMISTCLLPNIEAVANLQGVATVAESPHDSMQRYVEASWTCSTVFGILLFLAEIAVLCWVKFYDFSANAAIAATLVLVPVVVLFVAFAFHFYQKLVAYKYERSRRGLKELENMVSQMHQHHATDDAGGHNGPYVVTV